MRQAIVTKFHGPTNAKVARVSASASAGRMYVSWNDALDADGNHRAAAMAYAKKLGWHGRWHAGGLPDGRGNVYVVECGTDEEMVT